MFNDHSFFVDTIDCRYCHQSFNIIAFSRKKKRLGKLNFITFEDNVNYLMQKHTPCDFNIKFESSESITLSYSIFQILNQNYFKSYLILKLVKKNHLN